MTLSIGDILDDLLNPKPKHPKCQGYWTHGMDRSKFNCHYETTINCEDCKYGAYGGRKDPEAKCNQ